MTGRRPARGPADNPWLGGGPSEGDDAGVRGRWHGRGDSPSRTEPAVELRGLALRPVARRSGSGLGLAGAVAIFAVAALLAGGLGFLGGRREPSPFASATGAVIVGPPASIARTARPPAPAITPYTDCGRDPAEPPLISLQTNGVPTPGLVEVVDRRAESTRMAVPPTPAAPPELLRGPHVEVRPDVVTELWIDGAACALRWLIALHDPLSEATFEVEQAGIDADKDPRVAAQNRFNLSHAFGPHRALGHDLQLIGAFEFQDVAVVGWWRVAIQPLVLPMAMLRHGRTGEKIELVSGCHLGLRLANGYDEDMEACESDLSEELGAATPVAPGETLWLEFDGIAAGEVTMICGRLSGLEFVAEPEPGCWEHSDAGSIPVPDVRGDWTIAMSTCTTVGAGSASISNTLCGTWYADVRVLEANRDE